jgi:hypothetical protein
VAGDVGRCRDLGHVRAELQDDPTLRCWLESSVQTRMAMGGARGQLSWWHDGDSVRTKERWRSGDLAR